MNDICGEGIVVEGPNPDTVPEQAISIKERPRTCFMLLTKSTSSSPRNPHGAERSRYSSAYGGYENNVARCNSQSLEMISIID